MTYAKPLNVMDVDAIHVNMLTLEEKRNYQGKGAASSVKSRDTLAANAQRREKTTMHLAVGTKG
jgi:hypothetical protein